MNVRDGKGRVLGDLQWDLKDGTPVKVTHGKGRASDAERELVLGMATSDIPIEVSDVPLAVLQDLAASLFRPQAAIVEGPTFSKLRLVFTLAPIIQAECLARRGASPFTIEEYCFAHGNRETLVRSMVDDASSTHAPDIEEEEWLDLLVVIAIKAIARRCKSESFILIYLPMEGQVKIVLDDCRERVKFPDRYLTVLAQTAQTELSDLETCSKAPGKTPECPSETLIADFVFGKSTPTDAENEHMADCTYCSYVRQRAEQYMANASEDQD